MSAYRMSRARRAAIVACVSVVAATGVVGLRPFDAPVPRALADVGAEASGAANSGVVNPGSVNQESADAIDRADAAGGTGDSSGGVNTTVPGTSGIDSTRFEDVRDAVVARSEPVDLSSLSYADAYRTLWLRIEDGTDLLERLRGELSDATAAFELARVELTTAARHQDRADVESVRSGHDLDDAARDLYMTGSTGVDAAFQALSGSPEDVLASIDSVRYVTSAGDSETLDFERAAAEAARMQDATAVARARAVEATRAAQESAGILTTVRGGRPKARELLNGVDLPASTAPGHPMVRDIRASGKPCRQRRHPVLVPHGRTDAATPQAQLAVQWPRSTWVRRTPGKAGYLNDGCSTGQSHVSRAYVDSAVLITAGAD